ncbi:hypothetical protein EV702DRAFT_973876, partial [Suillus placidus]
DRTAYCKVLYSTCEGSDRIDRGTPHLCPGINGHCTIFWMLVMLFPFAITALVAWCWYTKSRMARGQVTSTLCVRVVCLPLKHRTICLPGGNLFACARSGVMAMLASVFLLGLSGIVFEYIASSLESVVSQSGA